MLSFRFTGYFRISGVVTGGVVLALMLFSSCAIFEPQSRPFYLSKVVHLPHNGQNNSTHNIKELRYLLLNSEVETSSNREAVNLALNGRWEESSAIYDRIGENNDCRVLNNQAMVDNYHARYQKATARLARAYHLCPDLEEVRWNLRALLKGNHTLKPEYRNHDAE